MTMLLSNISSAKPISLAALYLSLGLVLSHCSPSAPEKESTEETTSTSEQSTGNEASDHDRLMAEDGWRRGTLVIELDAQQKSQGDQQGDNPLNTNWETSIKAKAESQVWVAKDLRLFVSEEPDSDTRKEALNYEPYSSLDSAPEAKLSGSLTHAASSNLGDAESSIKRSVTETGTIRDLHIYSLHPSLYGKGYEVRVEFQADAKRQSSSTITNKQLPAPVIENQNTDADEKLSFSLYPIPNADKVNDYPYIPDGIDSELKVRIENQNKETLAALQQLAADTFPVQHDMRAGARSEATKDQLTLTYEYSGAKQVPFIASLDTIVGNSSVNTLKIKITLKAD